MGHQFNASENMGIKQHTPGTVRYFTYYLIFPDGETWCDQSPFVHDLQFQLRQTAWRNDQGKCRDLLVKGETTWSDHNGVKHRVVVEDVKRERVWGSQTKLANRKKRRF